MNVTESTEQLKIDLQGDRSQHIKDAIARHIRRQMNDFLLSPSDIPEYVDISVRYPDTLAKIRIQWR